MTSRLLTDEPPLHALPTLATLVGLNEAFVLQQVHYWLGTYRRSQDQTKFRKGRWWVYDSYTEWQKTNFPFWSVRTTRRIISSLESQGLLISEAFEKGDWDRRKWYTIDYDRLNELYEEWKTRTEVDGRSSPKSIFSQGYVYLLEGGGYHKIGKTEKLDRRIDALSPHLPFPVELVAAIHCENPHAEECAWHQRFAERRTHGEWFQLTEGEIVAFIEAAERN